MQRDRVAPVLPRNKDYLVLLVSQTISDAGSLVSGIAYPLLVLAVTRSAAPVPLLMNRTWRSLSGRFWG